MQQSPGLPRSNGASGARAAWSVGCLGCGDGASCSGDVNPLQCAQLHSLPQVSTEYAR